MSLQLIKFEDNDALPGGTWAVFDTVSDTLFRNVFFDELQGLIFVGCVERDGLKYQDSLKHSWLAGQIRSWLNEVAPRGEQTHYLLPASSIRKTALIKVERTGPRHIPDEWAAALCNLEDWEWQEEEGGPTIQRKPELGEQELIDMLGSRSGYEKAIRFLLEEFGNWEPARTRQS